ncbi:MAG: hypothetical protein IJ734_08070 [Fibrobacter sp.]|nr:hypothetical protein [Fibrobacter sp.]
MKLQDAYIAETGTGIGGFGKIGYEIPASTNFTYGGYTDKTSSELSSGKTDAWDATAKATLNDCVSGKWQLDISANTSSGGSATYIPKLTGGPTGDCAALTPNFCNIGGNAANCAATGS